MLWKQTNIQEKSLKCLNISLTQKDWRQKHWSWTFRKMKHPMMLWGTNGSHGLILLILSVTKALLESCLQLLVADQVLTLNLWLWSWRVGLGWLQFPACSWSFSRWRETAGQLDFKAPSWESGRRVWEIAESADESPVGTFSGSQWITLHNQGSFWGWEHVGGERAKRELFRIRKYKVTVTTVVFSILEQHKIL